MQQGGIVLEYGPYHGQGNFEKAEKRLGWRRKQDMGQRLLQLWWVSICGGPNRPIELCMTF